MYGAARDEGEARHEEGRALRPREREGDEVLWRGWTYPVHHAQPVAVGEAAEHHERKPFHVLLREGGVACAQQLQKGSGEA